MGSVGGALAVLLGLGSSSLLSLPLVLPVVSLMAALNREGLIAEGNRLQYDTFSSSISEESQHLAIEVKRAIDEVRTELRVQAATAGKLNSIEARLSSLEGSVLSAGRSVREAAASMVAIPERLHHERHAQYDSLIAAIQQELQRAGGAWATENAAAFSRLETRLAAVEGSLSGLEVAQSENVRRLALSLNGALADAGGALQASVRSEVSMLMEPVRKLSQMQAVPLASLSGTSSPMQPGQPGSPVPDTLDPEVLTRQVRAAVADELDIMQQRILGSQAEGFAQLSQARPAMLDEQQWTALGQRLARIELMVQQAEQGTEAALGTQLSQQLARIVHEAGQGAASDIGVWAAKEIAQLRQDMRESNSMVQEHILQRLSEAEGAVLLQQQQQEAAIAPQAEATVAATKQDMWNSEVAADIVALRQNVDSVQVMLSSFDAKLDALKLDIPARQADAATAGPSPGQAGWDAVGTSPEALKTAIAELQLSVTNLTDLVASLSAQARSSTSQVQVAQVAAAAEPLMPEAPAGARAQGKGTDLDSAAVESQYRSEPDTALAASTQLEERGKTLKPADDGHHPAAAQPPASAGVSGPPLEGPIFQELTPQQQASQQPEELRRVQKPVDAAPSEHGPAVPSEAGPALLLDQALIAEGLQLLRKGREAMRDGKDLGLADQLIQRSVAVFQQAAETSPSDAKAIGNLGNALLAQGELRKSYLDMLRAAPEATAPRDLEVQRSAESALRSEASQLLTRSGEMFKRVLELEGWSSRALVNWGRAMCIRAELADSRDVAVQLYGSALDKFEAVLEEDPSMAVAKYRAALAMLGIARCCPEKEREARVLLNDAANYARDVMSSKNPESASLGTAVAELLRQCEQMQQAM